MVTKCPLKNTNTCINSQNQEKMKTKHLFEEHVYLISNHSVARNPMFSNVSMQKYFIKKMEYYLQPISDILAYCLNDNEFQILVKTKSREDFATYFCANNKKKAFADFDIPESTYIFSQAMANLQVSFVKHFNWKYERSGALVAGRFERRLVESKQEMTDLILNLNMGVKKHHYWGLWLNDLMKSKEVMTSKWLYEMREKSLLMLEQGYLNGDIIDLASCFKNLPPYRLPNSKSYWTNKIYQLFGPGFFAKT